MTKNVRNYHFEYENKLIEKRKFWNYKVSNPERQLYFFKLIEADNLQYSFSIRLIVFKFWGLTYIKGSNILKKPLKVVKFYSKNK